MNYIQRIHDLLVEAQINEVGNPKLKKPRPLLTPGMLKHATNYPGKGTKKLISRQISGTTSTDLHPGVAAGTPASRAGNATARRRSGRRTGSR
jgi:hypothetical protein